jgi:nucleoside-diphosphate kinase
MVLVMSNKMKRERTLSLLKPDAVRRNITGKINQRFEEAGLRIVAQRRLQLTYDEAKRFYAVHASRPFFEELCQTISAGPLVAQVLEGENAILKNRELMGATNPAEAAAGTIRADLALSISENSVHGSDAPETAEQEIHFFFSEKDILS